MTVYLIRNVRECDFPAFQEVVRRLELKYSRGGSWAAPMPVMATTWQEGHGVARNGDELKALGYLALSYLQPVPPGQEAYHPKLQGFTFSERVEELLQSCYPTAINCGGKAWACFTDEGEFTEEVPFQQLLEFEEEEVQDIIEALGLAVHISDPGYGRGPVDLAPRGLEEA